MKKIFSCFIIITLISVSGRINAQNCIPDYIVFSDQSEIDSFQYYFPGCSHILGDIIISGNINNLYGLNVLRSIDGDLEITTTQYLPHLTGLDNLTLIGGDLIVIYNQALTGLAGLQNLLSVGGRIAITNNETLMSLSDLVSLETGTVSDLAIHDNPALFNCDIQGICDYLSDPNGHVDIFNNFPGCDNPPDIAEECGFTMSCLPYGDYYFLKQSDINTFQTDYSGCSILEGIVTISGEDISDLSGLGSVTSMGIYVKIEGCEMLSDLEGLENLSHIDGNLSIYQNPSLVDLAPLENLAYLGNMLEIGYNDNLADITALSKITAIGDMLWVGFNNSLTSLSGLDNIDPESFSHLVIVFNPLLSDCDVLSICEFIANQGGIIQIQDNEAGCDTQQEILDECAVGVKDVVVPEGIVHIYPNPASDMLFIESSEKVESVRIFGCRGGQVVGWSGGQGKVEVPVKDLAPGIYLVRVNVANENVSKKIIIMR